MAGEQQPAQRKGIAPETNPRESENMATERQCAETSARAGTDTVDIERRAYEIYSSRNGAPGDATSDWLQAEREIEDAK